MLRELNGEIKKERKYNIRNGDINQRKKIQMRWRGSVLWLEKVLKKPREYD